MGDGPTPGSPTDVPAISYDASTIVFTSDADNLVPGFDDPNGRRAHRRNQITSLSFDISRIDKTSTGYGGNNHNPTVSPDGRVVAWSSTTNYGSTPATYSQPQNWVYGIGLANKNVSGNYGLSPNFATRPPLLADNGHLVLFESQSPMSRYRPQ